MSEAVLGPKSAKYRVICGYTWKTPVYLENTWVSCRFPQFCPRFCPRPALRLRETREFPEGNSRETEWSTKHPLVSLETSGNAKCWGPSGFPLGCRKPSDRPTHSLELAATISPEVPCPRRPPAKSACLEGPILEAHIGTLHSPAVSHLLSDTTFPQLGILRVPLFVPVLAGFLLRTSQVR